MAQQRFLSTTGSRKGLQQARATVAAALPACSPEAPSREHAPCPHPWLTRLFAHCYQDIGTQAVQAVRTVVKLQRTTSTSSACCVEQRPPKGDMNEKVSRAG
jgi:hypothetical protein